MFLLSSQSSPSSHTGAAQQVTVTRPNNCTLTPLFASSPISIKMSGKATTGAAAKKIELTPREVEVLAAAWQSFKSDPEVSPKTSVPFCLHRYHHCHRHRRRPLFSLSRPPPGRSSHAGATSFLPYSIPPPLDLHPNHPATVNFHLYYPQQPILTMPSRSISPSCPSSSVSRTPVLPPT